MQIPTREWLKSKCSEVGGDSCIAPELGLAMLDEIDRLQAIVDAQSDVIGCYEDETDRSQHADDELPDDLLEAEKALKAAEDAKEPEG